MLQKQSTYENILLVMQLNQICTDTRFVIPKSQKAQHYCDHHTKTIGDTIVVLTQPHATLVKKIIAHSNIYHVLSDDTVQYWHETTDYCYWYTKYEVHSGSHDNYYLELLGLGIVW